MRVAQLDLPLQRLVVPQEIGVSLIPGGLLRNGQAEPSPFPHFHQLVGVINRPAVYANRTVILDGPTCSPS